MKWNCRQWPFFLTDPQLLQLFHRFQVCHTFMLNVCDLTWVDRAECRLVTTQRCYDMLWNVSHQSNQGPIWLETLLLEQTIAMAFPPHRSLKHYIFTSFCSIYLSLFFFFFNKNDAISGVWDFCGLSTFIMLSLWLYVAVSLQLTGACRTLWILDNPPSFLCADILQTYCH